MATTMTTTTTRTSALLRVLGLVTVVLVLQVHSAPTVAVTKQQTAKPEEIVRHKDVTSQKAAASSGAKELASKKEEPAKTVPPKVLPKVVLNPVPGQLETTMPVLPPGKSNKSPKPFPEIPEDNERDYNGFLEEAEAEEEENTGSQSSNDEYLKLQYLLSDPRLREILSSQMQQEKLDAEPREAVDSESPYSNELDEYLVRTKAFDRNIQDLVASGVMTPAEASKYRTAIDLDYDRVRLQSPEDYVQNVLEVPESAYDYGVPQEVYDETNYIQPLSQVDYSSDYSPARLPPPPALPEALVPADDSELSQEQEEEEEELIRDLIGRIAAQENLDYRPLSDAEEGELRQPSSVPVKEPLSLPAANSKEVVYEKELESVQNKSAAKPKQPAGTEEEKQLEEMRNRTKPEKSKQANSKKPTQNGH